MAGGNWFAKLLPNPIMLIPYFYAATFLEAKMALVQIKNKKR
ncbi:MAG TPA: hypothetical protein VF623_14735 [Segetibacter sp.]|jgi:hypothetical protein